MNGMVLAIVLLPLGGAILAGLFGRWLGKTGSQLVTCIPLVLSAVFACVIFADVVVGGHALKVPVADWFQSGDLTAQWLLRVDSLTAIMMIVVTVVSALVHIYSVGYMAHDRSVPRFMAYLSLFTFAMLALVTADNFVQLFFGWEGVGLASYLLIGFWYDRPSANAAAIKAFVVNRVGDFGFALGIFAIFFVFHAIQFDTVFGAAPGLAGKSFQFLGHNVDILTTICLLLFVGAMGKSAQLGLHTWLPDAMEGPTPVSALIHAATMVTAGVFMVVRCSPLFEQAPIALAVVTIVGAATCFFAATVGLVQNDIKRVIAYSTCSQLGYMFFAAGLSAYPVAIFHLFTHAFFKALLFLGSGSVIHAMSDEQDMRKMGGLWRRIPFTYAMMVIGTLSLMGFPLTAGYFSKDAAIFAAFTRGTDIGMFAFVIGCFVAFLTALYSWRLIFMTFHGKPRASDEVMHHVHESPLSMLLPLVGLAIGALLAGALFAPIFVGEHWAQFWRGAVTILPAHDVMAHLEAHKPFWVEYLPTVAGLVGLALAWFCYIRRPDIPASAARTQEPLYLFLLNKWYFDDLYEVALVRPAKWLGRVLWKGGDGAVIDGLGPDGVAATVLATTRRVVRLQTGYLYHYAFAMLLGVAILVTYYMFAGPHG